MNAERNFNVILRIKSTTLRASDGTPQWLLAIAKNGHRYDVPRLLQYSVRVRRLRSMSKSSRLPAMTLQAQLVVFRGRRANPGNRDLEKLLKILNVVCNIILQ